MLSKVEDITINYEEDGLLKVKEIDKVILTKGAWTTIMFKYQQWEPKNEDYSKEKYSIRRYRKLNDNYQPQSKFNISSDDQAKKIIEVLQGWIS